jgi:dsRNA-specific ribonuclease
LLNHVVTGTGSNRKHAEQNAAAAALELLDQSNGRK